MAEESIMKSIVFIKSRLKLFSNLSFKDSMIPLAVIAFLNENLTEKVLEKEYYIVKEEDIKRSGNSFSLLHDFTFSLLRENLPHCRVHVNFVIVFTAKDFMNTSSPVYDIKENNYPTLHIPDTCLVYEYKKGKEETTL